MMAFMICSVSSLSSPWTSMSPSARLGSAAWSGTPLCYDFLAVLALSFEPVMSRFQILGRGRAFFTGGPSGRFAPNASFLDTICLCLYEDHRQGHQPGNNSIRGVRVKGRLCRGGPSLRAGITGRFDAVCARGEPPRRCCGIIRT